MARRLNLQEYQENILSRLKEVRETQGASSHLGIQIGEDAWMLKLGTVAEVLPVPEIHHVPLTRSWFLGMANVRGNLYAVTDISAFFGGRPARMTGESRLLLVGNQYGVNAALVVDRLFGLRNITDMNKASTAQSKSSWHVATYMDSSEREWRELDLAVLLNSTSFMQVAA